MVAPGSVVDDAPNLLIFIADALRRDHHPDIPGTTRKTITSGPSTPTCIPSLLSGVDANTHGITWFWGDPITVPTVFDLEAEGYDVSYFDHPADRLRDCLRHPPFKGLRELEPPLVYVEREVVTHTPYNVTWREIADWEDVGPRPEPRSARSYPDGYTGKHWSDGNDYIDLMARGAIDFQADYREAVMKAVERFMGLLDVLAAKGITEDTCVIWTADHGEAWGGRLGVDDCNHTIHEDTGCNHVMEVATTYADRELDLPDTILQRDILSYWDDRWAGGRSDLEIQDRDPSTVGIGERGDEAAKQRLRDLGYIE